MERRPLSNSPPIKLPGSVSLSFLGGFPPSLVRKLFYLRVGKKIGLLFISSFFLRRDGSFLGEKREGNSSEVRRFYSLSAGVREKKREKEREKEGFKFLMILLSIDHHME